MSDLTPEQIEELLKLPTPTTGKSGGRAKVDPTAVREVNVWFKLSHHLCLPDCEHRAANPTGNGRACYNPNCVDPRDPLKDRGSNIVVLVKGQWICRYCFLAGYLAYA